ncbi:MAG: S53 family peptidase [Acidimicrobiales bacterium]
MRAIRRRALAATCGITAVLSFAVPAAVAGRVPAGAARQDPAASSGRAVVAGLDPIPVPGARDLGDASGPASATLVLAPRDSAGLAALFSRQQSAVVAHRPVPVVTPSTFTQRFGPTPAGVAAARSWALRADLRVESVSTNRVLVRVSGRAGQLGAAFGTGLHRFEAPGVGAYVAPAARGRVPAALAGRLTAVVGLSTIGRLHGDVRPAGATSLVFRSYGPADLERLYHAPPAAVGSGQQVAVLASGDMAPVLHDLRLFEHRFGRPSTPVALRFVDGGSPDTTGTIEWDLDTQYGTGLAPGAHLLLYTGRSLGTEDILDEFNAFVTDNRARQANASFGLCEQLASLVGFQAAADQLLAQGVAQGQTLFSSSGDTGAFCPVGPLGLNGVPAGYTGVDYPAASPYVVGVGGTSLLAPGGSPNEVAWFASGGGPSQTTAQPSWQSRAGGSDLGVSRGVPDVALDADPQSGYVVIVDGQPKVVGGTSASSPSWMAFWARAQGAHRGGLGFANPVLYRLPASTFRDITTGTNALYPATAGWDYVTGRGVPDVSALVTRS